MTWGRAEYRPSRGGAGYRPGRGGTGQEMGQARVCFWAGQGKKETKLELVASPLLPQRGRVLRDPARRRGGHRNSQLTYESLLLTGGKLLKITMSLSARLPVVMTAGSVRGRRGDDGLGEGWRGKERGGRRVWFSNANISQEPPLSSHPNSAWAVKCVTAATVACHALASTDVAERWLPPNALLHI